MQFIIHFLPVSSGFLFHTHAFRSLLRVIYALRAVHVTSVMSHNTGYNAVAGGGLWRRQPSSAHELALVPNKTRTKGGKVEILWVHTYPTTSSRPRGRRVQSLVQIGSEMWICISSIQTFIFIYKVYISNVTHRPIILRCPEMPGKGWESSLNSLTTYVIH